tara:strand:+ start:3708 stop:6575 length:2868 start_codon:yes stop_codon:yes gene_type:complete
MALEKEVLVQTENTEPSAEPTWRGYTLEQYKKLSPTSTALPTEEEVPVKKIIEDSGESEWAYGWAKGNGFVENSMLYLEAVSPVFAQALAQSSPAFSMYEGTSSSEEADQVYGEGFSEMSTDERRKVLLGHRQEQLRNEFPVLSQVPSDELSWRAGVSELLSVATDPTSLLPMGAAAKTVALTSGLITAGYNVSDQLVQTGEVDPKQVALYGVGGAAGGYVLAKGASALGSKIKAGQAKKKTAKELVAANESIDKIDYVLAKASANDLNLVQASKLIESELGLSKDDVLRIITQTDRKPTFPTKLNAEVLLSTIKNSSESGKITNGLFEQLLGNISTKLKEVSEPMALRLRGLEMNTHADRQLSTDNFRAFNSVVKKVPKDLKTTFNTHLINGELNSARKIITDVKGNSGGKAFDSGIKELDRLYDLKIKAGMKVDKIDNYFPRVIKDLEGLQKALNKNRKVNGVYEKALIDFAKTKSKPDKIVEVRDLSKADRERVISRVVMGYKSSTVNKKMSWNKDRTLPKVTEELSQYYEDAGSSIISHLNSSAAEVNKRRFFKGSAVSTNIGDDLDIDDSVSALISKELSSMSRGDQDIVQSLLKSRFGMGEVAPHKFIRTVRDLGYMSVLANPYSAMTQIGDIGVSAFTQGLLPTLQATFSKKLVSMKSFGLDNVLASEFTNVKDASTALHKLFTWSGFRRVDRFGKDILLNAAYKNAKTKVKSAAGEAQLAKKYKKAFGTDDFNKLVNELKAGETSERVKLLLWSELSDAQPISLSEMPQAFLDHPNGRIAYALKSFGLKQLNLIRTKIVREFKHGSKTEATKQMARYLVLVSLAGASVKEIKDFAKGKGFNPKEIVKENMFDTVLSLAFASKYQFSSSVAKGEFLGSFLEQVVPPIPMIDSVLADSTKMYTGSREYPEDALKEVPIVGMVSYMWLGGGMEKAIEKDKKKKYAERPFK